MDSDTEQAALQHEAELEQRYEEERMDLSKLKDPFPPEDLEWRLQQSGKNGDRIWAIALTYVTNRAIQERLDSVCGPENWRNEYHTGPNGGVICGISIKIGGEWVTKWDGADNPETEPVKGGLSNAMKRAAVQWGIGRYLYRLDAAFVETSKERQNGDGWEGAKLKQGGERFWWKHPEMPAWALPQSEAPPAEQPAPKSTDGEYEQIVRRHAKSIKAIKDGIASGDLSSAAEAWYELSQDDMQALWKAPTKGGCFTTEERKVMKTTEFREAYYGPEQAVANG